MKMQFPDWEIYLETMEADQVGNVHFEESRGFYIVDAATENVVCDLYVNDGHSLFSYEEAERNAMLISAAPKLLQELLEMVKMFRPHAESIGPKHEQAILDAMEAIRSTMSADEVIDEIKSGVLAAVGMLS